MEESKSFFELADPGAKTSFEPEYTAEFKSYLENSIRQSDYANREAIRTASALVINC